MWRAADTALEVAAAACAVAVRNVCLIIGLKLMQPTRLAAAAVTHAADT